MMVIGSSKDSSQGDGSTDSKGRVTNTKQQ
jgi:hypothetical protein